MKTSLKMDVDSVDNVDQTEVFYWLTVDVRLTFSSRPKFNIFLGNSCNLSLYRFTEAKE